MDWWIFVIATIIANSSRVLLHKYIVKEHDPVSYAAFWYLASSVFAMPLFLIDFALPIKLEAFGLALFASAIWFILGIVSFHSIKLIDISLYSPLVKIKALFVLLFAVLFLGEGFGLLKIFGILLIVGGGSVLTWKKGFGGKLKNEGINLALLTAILGALVRVVDKAAMAYWSPSVYTFIQYLFPGLALGFITRKKLGVHRLMKKKPWLVLLVGLLGTLGYYFELSTFKLIEVSIAVPLFFLSQLLIVGGGILLLREVKNVKEKLIGTLLMLGGSWLITSF